MFLNKQSTSPIQSFILVQSYKAYDLEVTGLNLSPRNLIRLRPMGMKMAELVAILIMAKVLEMKKRNKLWSARIFGRGT